MHFDTFWVYYLLLARWGGGYNEMIIISLDSPRMLTGCFDLNQPCALAKRSLKWIPACAVSLPYFVLIDIIKNLL